MNKTHKRQISGECDLFSLPKTICFLSHQKQSNYSLKTSAEQVTGF